MFTYQGRNKAEEDQMRDGSGVERLRLGRGFFFFFFGRGELIGLDLKRWKGGVVRCLVFFIFYFLYFFG